MEYADGVKDKNIDYISGVVWANHIYSKNNSLDEITILDNYIQSNRINQNTGTSTGIKALTSIGWHCFSLKFGKWDSLVRFLLRKEREYYKFFNIDTLQIADVKGSFELDRGY